MLINIIINNPLCTIIYVPSRHFKGALWVGKNIDKIVKKIWNSNFPAFTYAPPAFGVYPRTSMAVLRRSTLEWNMVKRGVRVWADQGVHSPPLNPPSPPRLSSVLRYWDCVGEAGVIVWSWWACDGDEKSGREFFFFNWRDAGVGTRCGDGGELETKKDGRERVSARQLN